MKKFTQKLNLQDTLITLYNFELHSNIVKLLAMSFLFFWFCFSAGFSKLSAEDQKTVKTAIGLNSKAKNGKTVKAASKAEPKKAPGLSEEELALKVRSQI